MYANYHTHTMRCGHAVGEDREYIEAAIKAGIKILGFSDHCPWVYPDNFVSGIRMRADQTDDYFSSLENLRKEYADDITVLIGFEAEYVPDLIDAQDNLLASYPLDYMILGQHFLGTECGSAYAGSPTDCTDFFIEYVDTVIAGLDTGRYLYLAHPDLINYTGDDAIYREHMTRLCRYLKEKNIPAELNMLGAYQGRNYPSDKFLQIVREVGNTCIIGIDAHDPAHLTNELGYKACQELIQQYHLHIIEKMI